MILMNTLIFAKIVGINKMKDEKIASQVGKDLAGESQDNASRPDNNDTKESISRVKEPKQDEILISIASKRCQLFHDDQDEAYAKIKIKNHIEVWNITSLGFKDWIARELWKQYKQGLNKSSFDSALTTLRGMAIYDGHIEQIYLRVAQLGDFIFIDLCNKKWQAIQVSSSGWVIVDESPVSFIRSRNMQPLRIPENNGNIHLLKKHLNIHDQDFPLIVGWLLMSMQAGRGAYPIMVLQGTAGCGKTTISRMLRELVDPNKADLLSKPKTQDMRVIGVNNHVLAFDNLSGIHPNYSDALCKIATGDNQTIRVLYTTNDEMTISIKKPILLNGIDEIVVRGDLISRSVKIELQKLKQSRTESSVWSDFIKDAPSILGALLDGLSVALSRADHIKIDKLLRMGDFCKWASAASSVYGWNEDQFMTAYRANISSSYVDSIEASTFASGVVKMFKSRLEFTGTPLELLRQVEGNFVSEKVRHSHKWVTTAKGVMSKLNRYQDALEVFGIRFNKTRDRTNRTILSITRDVSTYDKAIVSSQTNEEWSEEYNSA